MNEHGPFIPNRFQPTNDDTKRRDTSLEAWTKLAPLRAALLEAESSDTRSPQMRQDALVAAFAEISAFSTSQIADAIQFSTEAAWKNARTISEPCSASSKTLNSPR